MKVLLAPTEDFIRRNRAQLAGDASKGSSVDLTFDNSAGFSANDYIVVGTEGSDTAELVQITAITDNTVTVNTLQLDHRKDEPIVGYRFNQRKFYGSTSATGSFFELTTSGSPKDIAVDDPTGTLLEYNGDEGYTYFKATYYNSTETAESSLDDATAVLADESTRYCSLYAIRVHAGIAKNPYIDDGRVEAKRKQAENEVNSFINARYSLPLTNSSGEQEVPALITRCTVLLAAGYLDYEEYMDDSEGVKWLGEARGILKRLQNPSGQQLLGSDNKEMQTHSGAGQLNGYPNNGTTDQPPVFSMIDRF